MKKRKVVVTVECETNMPIKDLKQDVLDNFAFVADKESGYVDKTWYIRVNQVQTNVIKGPLITRHWHEYKLDKSLY